jgi:hypothetical protein
LRQAADKIRFDDEAMIASIADDLAAEATKRGQTIAWPAGMSLETASKRGDYPASLWMQAETRWNQLGPTARQDQKRQRALLAMALSEQGRQPSFGECFAPWDLLWFGLAIFTAYKVGAGTYRTD